MEEVATTKENQMPDITPEKLPFAPATLRSLREAGWTASIDETPGPLLIAQESHVRFSARNEAWENYSENFKELNGKTPTMLEWTCFNAAFDAGWEAAK